MGFKSKLEKSTSKNNSLLCVGLDPDIIKMPDFLASSSESLFEFNKAIIDATADLVCAFKPNSAFYESMGSGGINQLQKTCAYISDKYPHLPILLDFKRGDIGNTNKYYAQFAFDYLNVDAITIQPYMGLEANRAYLEYKEKGIFVLCRTSNPGAGEFQDIGVGGSKLYQHIAKEVWHNWNENGNCYPVMGSPYPSELSWARKELGENAVFLVPGAGTQGGDIESTVKSGKNEGGTGLIINSSRGVIYASNGEDFAKAAKESATLLKEEINRYR